MPHTNLRRLIGGFVLIFFLSGCTTGSFAPVPTQPSPPTPTSAAPQDAKVFPSSTPTSAAFILQPTFTPFSTATVFSIDGMTGTSYGPSSFPAGINPLTGLVVEKPELLERRPMVIKVTNFPRQVRPQWGLSLADHIFEYYLEDGMTRFVGIFYSQEANRVGPVRSARPFDYHLVKMYKAIFAFGYADKKVWNPLKASDIADYLVIERPGNCPPMCRIGPDSDYNTLFTDTGQLSKYISDRGVDNSRQNLDGLRFSDYPLQGGGQVSEVLIRFSSTSHHKWEYNAARNTYLRSQETAGNPIGQEVYEPLYDNLTKRWLWADNLVILLVPTGFYYESNSTEIYEIQLEGTGPGYALRDGKIFEVLWSRPTPESLVTVTFPNGNLFPLRPGNVWFEVLSDKTVIETTASGIWRFYFDLPEGTK
ncbi:DUF3048 domain-containing protein [Chloroflexota bacterium]